MLYRSMQDLEANYWDMRYPNESPEKIEIFKKASFSMSGEFNDADSSGMNLCFWYTVNLLNYARCCGLVQFIQIKRILPEALANNKSLIKELREFQKNYIDSVSDLTPIKHFRDKAGAHIAFTDPKETHDNPATLIESLSLIPCFAAGRFTIGLMPRGKGAQWKMSSPTIKGLEVDLINGH